MRVVLYLTKGDKNRKVFDLTGQDDDAEYLVGEIRRAVEVRQKVKLRDRIGRLRENLPRKDWPRY